MTKWCVVGVTGPGDLFVLTAPNAAARAPSIFPKTKVGMFRTRRAAIREAAKLLERGWLKNTGALTLEEYERKLIERDLLLTNLRSQI